MKDFEHQRSHSSSYSSGSRPVACAISSGCVVEEELLALLRLLSGRCVFGRSFLFSLRVTENLSGKTFDCWTSTASSSAEACCCLRLSSILGDHGCSRLSDRMGGVFSIEGQNMQSQVRAFCCIERSSRPWRSTSGIDNSNSGQETLWFWETSNDPRAGGDLDSKRRVSNQVNLRSLSS